MARNTVHDQYLISYLFYLVIWNLFHPEITPEEAAQQLNLDISCILAIWQIRYLQADLWLSQSPVHWIWHGSTSKMNLTTIVSQICSMLPLQSFRFCMISFKNILYSAITQIIPKPHQTQLAVTLYCMGRYGNGASLEDIAQIAGISEGLLCSAMLRACINVLLSSNNHIWTWLSGTVRGHEWWAWVVGVSDLNFERP